MATEPARLTAKGRATRDRIVGVASELMLTQGVARTTIEDIQREASVSASQLYHYFADKHALVHAVIERQTTDVLGFQRLALDRLDSFAALQEWRDMAVAVMEQRNCTGGCPLGTLASELAETDPAARDELATSFGRWEKLLRDGLAAMRTRGELVPEADPDRLALALLAAVQGGLLLSQTRRDSLPLEVALDTSIAYVRTFAPSNWGSGQRVG
ncbi:TetR/AcrR family transcriptional regulator [Fodinicola feengrottensis]|uniref:TetR/AcrR family transcriptional regulator n=1 Tax=Fodinicola feengrottensis TaxID=435914 RepID=A0ABN2GQR6_9ACTN|nr:TetR/AcrR family transcriptional regulator [Fodinicola feengrottensis]